MACWLVAVWFMPEVDYAIYIRHAAVTGHSSQHTGLYRVFDMISI